jgi:hypothetical protein
MALRRRRQRGQALLLVLVFLAAFLLLIWAALRLASSAFLGLGDVRADTRTTYALDAGIAYGVNRAQALGGSCVASNPPPFTLAYPSGNITVTVTITVGPGCAANATYDLQVSASGTSRIAHAEVTQSQNGNGGPQNPFALSWEQFQ